MCELNWFLIDTWAHFFASADIKLLLFKIVQTIWNIWTPNKFLSSIQNSDKQLMSRKIRMKDSIKLCTSYPLKILLFGFAWNAKAVQAFYAGSSSDGSMRMLIDEGYQK